jgi:hypothetical protein
MYVDLPLLDGFLFMLLSTGLPGRVRWQVGRLTTAL